MEYLGGSARSKAKLAAILSPSVLSLVIILLFLKDVYYIDGAATRYSMGVSVIACYISLVVYFGMILSLIVIKYNTILGTACAEGSF